MKRRLLRGARDVADMGVGTPEAASADGLITQPSRARASEWTPGCGSDCSCQAPPLTDDDRSWTVYSTGERVTMREVGPGLYAQGPALALER